MSEDQGLKSGCFDFMEKLRGPGSHRGATVDVLCALGMELLLQPASLEPLITSLCCVFGWLSVLGEVLRAEYGLRRTNNVPFNTEKRAER